VSGGLAANALRAARDLEKKHIKVIVVNIHTIKPLDEDLIIKVVKETKAIVTVEEHQIAGGLGGAVAECLAKHAPAPIEFVGVKDQFGQSGTPKELIEYYGMGRDGIIAAVLKVFERKG
jgi:transketolase